MDREEDVYVTFVEKNNFPIIPLMERKNSRMKRFEDMLEKSGHLWQGIKFGLKFGGSLGFATGVIMGVATFRSHKSFVTVIAQGVGMSIFVAALMTAGNLLSVFDEQNEEKIKFAYLREFNTERREIKVRDEPFWVELHKFEEDYEN